jgi:hypothetical protein
MIILKKKIKNNITQAENEAFQKQKLDKTPKGSN